MTGRAQNVFYPDEDLHFSNLVTRLPAQWSLSYNPANLAGTDKALFGIYCRNLYRIEGLNAAAFGCAMPFGQGAFEFSAYSVGYHDVHENRFGFSYAKKLTTWLQAGIGLHLDQLNQPEGYTDLYAVVPSVGIRLFPLKNMVTGISVFNPANQSYTPKGYARLPSRYSFTAGYQFGEEFFIGLLTDKTTGERLHYSAVAEIVPVKKLYCSIHIHFDRMPGYSVETGYISGRLAAVFGFSYQPVGGWSPSLNLMYSVR
jgi:hypothetical protein